MNGQAAWYSVVNRSGELNQGDLVREVPIMLPPKEIVIGQQPDVNVDLYNVAVLSQSCDLQYGKISIVLVCPYWELSQLEERDDRFAGAKNKNRLRDGEYFGYHLLNKCEIKGLETGFLVVEFRNVFGIHVEVLKNLCQSIDQRIRLNPPYREHLSQSFARFFMRVGLPSDIPKF